MNNLMQIYPFAIKRQNTYKIAVSIQKNLVNNLNSKIKSDEILQNQRCFENFKLIYPELSYEFDPKIEKDIKIINDLLTLKLWIDDLKPEKHLYTRKLILNIITNNRNIPIEVLKLLETIIYKLDT